MQPATPLSDILSDLQDARVIWQIAAIAGALAVAWGVNWLLQRRFAEQSGVRRVLNRIGTPVIALLLLVIARVPLAKLGGINLIGGAIMLLLTFAAIRLTVYAMRRIFSKQVEWLGPWERAVSISLWVVFALIFTGLATDVWGWMRSVEFALGKIKLNLAESLAAIVSVLITLLAALWAGSAIEARLMAAQRLDSSTKTILSRVAKALLLVIGVLGGLGLVGIDLTVLSVFGGALGVGLGLGLQRIASNYFSGFIILMDRSIKIGDMITVDKYYGRVTQINTRYTVLQALDQSEAIIPNEMLVATPVQSNSYSNPSTRGLVKLSITFYSDLERALQLLEECAQSQPRIIRHPAPAAQAVGYAAEGVELELSFWVGDPENGTGNVRSDLIRAISKAFKENGIEMPHTQRKPVEN
jgi:small-conductance mechanosensitive channel